MKKVVLFMMLVTALVVFGAAAAQAGVKVEICHVPPGNPANFHTISVSANALPAHLAHGDLSGSCFGNCDTLCDDGDACTIDACDPDTELCSAEHPAVNCDDSLFCTTDSCDSDAGGCLNVPIDCSDDDLCTLDVCNEYEQGECQNPANCPEGDDCDPQVGDCVDLCANVICTPPACHLPGTCFAGVCSDPVPQSGTPCDDGDTGTTDDQCTNGVCAGISSTPCPCWTQAELAATQFPSAELRGVCDKDFTGSGSVNRDSWTLSPCDSNFPISKVRTQENVGVSAATPDGLGPHCLFQDGETPTTTVTRFLPLTLAEFASCEADVASSAAIRGLDLTMPVAQSTCGLTIGCNVP